MPKKTDDHVDDLDDPAYDPPTLLEPAPVTGTDEPVKPELKPGDAGYDWAPHYGSTPAADLYTHTFPGGTTVAIRTFGSIYSKTWLYKLRNAQTDTDIQFAAIDRAACDTAQAIIEAVDAPLGGPDPIDELWEAWSKAGTSHIGDGDGLTTGE